MDVAYNQHSPHHRRQLSCLTLAPLTSDHDEVPDRQSHHVSYIEGRSAPTTPSVLSRSSSRVSIRKPRDSGLLKSKSSTHLLADRPKHRPGTTTPGGTPKMRRGVTREDLNLSSFSAKDRTDSDWLLRAGATISSSTRESKGQAWLVSRASSTCLTGERDEDEEALQQALAREREQTSRGASRRGSVTGDADDEFSPITTRRSFSFGPGSRSISRYGSRATSRRGSRSQPFTPFGCSEKEDYFDHKNFDHQAIMTKPDFVNGEEEENEEEEDYDNDEAVVRKLARASSLGVTGWLEKLLGWSLFPVDEEGEDTEVEAVDEKTEDSEISLKTSRRAVGGVVHSTIKGIIPPLKDDDAGTWQDAAWLLSVASKVIF